MSTKNLEELVKLVQKDPRFWHRRMLFGFTHGIDRILFAEKKTRRDLAVLAKKPESNVSRALSGKQNLNIKSMHELAEALGAAVHIHVEKKGVRGAWVPIDEMRPSVKSTSDDSVKAGQARTLTLNAGVVEEIRVGSSPRG